jgi:hypothetical protein
MFGVQPESSPQPQAARQQKLSRQQEHLDVVKDAYFSNASAKYA